MCEDNTFMGSIPNPMQPQIQQCVLHGSSQHFHPLASCGEKTINFSGLNLNKWLESSNGLVLVTEAGGNSSIILASIVTYGMHVNSRQLVDCT